MKHIFVVNCFAIKCYNFEKLGSPVSALYPTIFNKLEVHLLVAILWRSFDTDAIRVKKTRKSPSAIAFCRWCTAFKPHSHTTSVEHVLL